MRWREIRHRAPKTSFCPQARYADAPEQWCDGERYATHDEALSWNNHLLRSHDDIVATRVIASELEPTARFNPNPQRWKQKGPRK